MPDDGRCKDCKHWTRNTHKHDDKRYGDCACGELDYMPYGISDNDGDDMLTYSDYEGYSATFSTGQNFGCIHFEEK